MTQSFGLPAPVVAPWATSWNNYPVQIYNLTPETSDGASVRIPTGQWWRILTVQASFTTSGISANRTMGMAVTSVSGPADFIFTTPGLIAASSAATMLLAPNLSSYTLTDTANNVYSVAGLPDLIWPPLALFTLGLNNDKTGDLIVGKPIFAVEIFTEDAEGRLEPATEPMPSPIIV